MTDAGEGPELSLIDSDDLIEELFRRFDHAIFGGIKTFALQSNQVLRHFDGNHHTCVGLAIDVIDMIRRDIREEQSDE